MGTLRVEGRLALKQFYPAGESDGDTAHVTVERVLYEGKETSIFDGAYVQGRGKKTVIHNGALTIRFQGIDAPELHFQPTVRKDQQVEPTAMFRQRFGRAAADALGKYLQTLGSGDLKCAVVSEVERPNDVFDTYGRMVGNILVQTSGGEVDVNLWMAKEGWAFPTFYTSMMADEITRFREAADDARRHHRGIWDSFSQELFFEPDLKFKDAQDGPDGGPVVLPKLFRRLATAYVEQGTTSDFHEFLASQSRPDRCYLTDEFLDQGPTVALQHELAEFVRPAVVTFKPADLVFQESPSTLYDKAGRRIRAW